MFCFLRTEWHADAHAGTVVLCQRHRDGSIERTRTTPFMAHSLIAIDSRNGTEIVGAWIEAGDEMDSGFTVSI